MCLAGLRGGAKYVRKSGFSLELPRFSTAGAGREMQGFAQLDKPQVLPHSWPLARFGGLSGWRLCKGERAVTSDGLVQVLFKHNAAKQAEKQR